MAALSPASLVPLALGALLAPLFSGVIVRVKAWFAGRAGPPLLQPYRDLLRLGRKGAVFSRATTWIFRAAPVAAVPIAVVALALVPAGGLPSMVSFPGDFLFLAGLFALLRFAMVLAALDTGSSFEGMGASREAALAALAEPALLLALIAVARLSRDLSLDMIIAAAPPAAWGPAAPAILLVIGTLFAVFLTENARIPVDDPATHLELTMIHEVMLLDHSGPDLALLEYAAALKQWTLGALIVGLAVPLRTGRALFDAGLFLAGMLLLAGVVGAVESSLARLRLARVPQLLVGAAAFAVLALVLVLR